MSSITSSLSLSFLSNGSVCKIATNGRVLKKWGNLKTTARIKHRSKIEVGMLNLFRQPPFIQYNVGGCRRTCDPVFSPAKFP
ncbi:hypothetical protein [Runella sp. SP2]|uniref:hypothetical protein n=1 Tax=Runella sp. SP2 TaxID=2268026 RepID=UPI0013DD8BD4|nr:hypothetical protein [Runella sp. SP2]